MIALKKEIINRLKAEILPLEGLKGILSGETPDLGLGVVNQAFPQGHFPLGAVHEFICEGHAAASAGFISGILGGLMRKGGVAIWVGSSRIIYPPALKLFGIDPERVVFIDLQKEKDVLWAMEEALKCEGLVAVIGEIPELSFTVSRRFQLAVEQSQVTGFILRNNPRHLQANACVSRWKIKSIASESYEALPGIGFLSWEVELQKIRNGNPGSWQITWDTDCFRILTERLPSIISEPKRKTG